MTHYASESATALAQGQRASSEPIDSPSVAVVSRTDEPDAADKRTVKLIADLDGAIRAVRKVVPMTKPWQRQLRVVLDRADREMQVLLMTGVMQKSDDVIREAADAVCVTCGRLGLTIQGGRADATVRTGVHLITQMAEALARLIHQETRT